MIALVATVGHGSSALWYLTRSTGLVSLILLSATVTLGTVASVGWTTERWPRFLSQSVHRNLSLFCIALIGVHVVSTVGDGYVPISLLDAVIPFRTPDRPIWVGLGALAFDMLLAVAITSGLRRRIGTAAWRGVHWLAYVCWPVAVVHGLGSGSDSRLAGTLFVYIACVGTVVTAVAWRLSIGRARSTGWRAGAALGGAVVLVLIAAFAMIGPLRPGWAHRAGTSPRSQPTCRRHDHDDPRRRHGVTEHLYQRYGVLRIGDEHRLGCPGDALQRICVRDGAHHRARCQRKLRGHPDHAAPGQHVTTRGQDQWSGGQRGRVDATELGNTGHDER